MSSIADLFDDQIDQRGDVGALQSHQSELPVARHPAKHELPHLVSPLARVPDNPDELLDPLLLDARQAADDTLSLGDPDADLERRFAFLRGDVKDLSLRLVADAATRDVEDSSERRRVRRV